MNVTRTLKRIVAAGLAVAVVAGAGVAAAQQMAFFRIGTGGTAGTYFPIGGLLANAISNPPGSRPCDQGGSCGVPGLIATAVASNGSVANINAIASGGMESGFTQSDVAYWAYTGTGVYEGKDKVEGLRSIANLYPETIHLVARKGAGIKSPADLKGKRVSLDEPGSGTLIDARIVLGAYGISEKDIKPEYLKPNAAGDRLRDGALDAFFFVGGYPAGAISELATSAGVELVPIAGPESAKILADYKFFAKDTVPAGTYKDVGETATISVNAQWVTSTKIADELVYGVTKALWNDNSRKLMDAGHAKGKAIRKETALDGLGVPLHPGAEKFYKEVGLLK
ncbi:immunogenic protein [Prosthecomicrobium hirschii]|uniref:TAXI family TRAP transporter solute-binding subunit n=1 Tax=Prosthecodimorpha hirschii TaxID=665126 RepID=UPI00112AAA4F|nr:TAXI family TRAP transporter solute-binding subunit [Prosthecomicrobium hirschii]TPQ48898.1 immunogenic protein [Prosthecomicrobium hirschii]